jgi:16S rRNA (guanine527-N7)-methyltransferase
VSSDEVAPRIRERAARFGLEIPDATVERFLTYLVLLTRWNSTINLTSLELTPLSDLALDRLLIEPLAAARFVDESVAHWFDLGSGGGSPAIPLKLLRMQPHLTMVESKGRKVAFLREAIRALDLRSVDVDHARIEDISVAKEGTANLVTVRAVRGDEILLKSAGALLRPRGRLLWFGFGRTELTGLDLRPVARHQLLDQESSTISIFERMFHVEQGG